MTTLCTGIAGGHLTNTADPGWCVYSAAEVAPPAPPWNWPAARQAVIVRAAETARRQRQDRRRRAEWRAAALRMDAAITRDRLERRITAA